MKKIGLILLMIVAMAFTSQAQGLYGHGGYSWTKGAFGAEYRSGYWGFGLGGMPHKTPITGKRLTSVSVFASYYTVEEDDIDGGWYLRLATTSKGYIVETTYGYDASPMTVATGGWIWNIDGIYLSFGVGYGFGHGTSTPVFESTLGIRLFKL